MIEEFLCCLVKHSSTKGSLCTVSVCLSLCPVVTHECFAGDTCIPWSAAVLVEYTLQCAYFGIRLQIGRIILVVLTLVTC